MSENTPVEDNNEKPTSPETPEVKKETPTQEKSETSKYEGKDAAELAKLLAEKEKVIQDKHNMGLSAQEELKKYKQKEEEERTAQLEKQGDYETLISETKAFRENAEAKEQQLSEELETLKKENEAYQTDMLNQALSVIPEDKRGMVESITAAYTGKERIEKIKETAEAIGIVPGTFGGPIPAEKVKKSGSRLEELEEKFTQGNITPLENAELRKLRK